MKIDPEFAIKRSQTESPEGSLKELQAHREKRKELYRDIACVAVCAALVTSVGMMEYWVSKEQKAALEADQKIELALFQEKARSDTDASKQRLSDLHEVYTDEEIKKKIEYAVWNLPRNRDGSIPNPFMPIAIAVDDYYKLNGAETNPNDPVVQEKDAAAAAELVNRIVIKDSACNFTLTDLSFDQAKRSMTAQDILDQVTAIQLSVDQYNQEEEQRRQDTPVF